MGAVTIGVDIGQRVDPTAIVVVERERRDGDEEHFTARHLERLPLGTPYPAVAERVAEIAAGVQEKTGRGTYSRPAVFADATGVGLPVVELIRAKELNVTGCWFTYGDKRTEQLVEHHTEVRIGKGFLVSRLQALLQTDRLHLPRTSEAEALADELLNYEIKVDPDGDAKFGAFKTGTHDDLVTALGLAVQPVTNYAEEQWGLLLGDLRECPRCHARRLVPGIGGSARCRGCGHVELASQDDPA